MTKLTNRNAPRAKLIHPKLPSFKLTEAQLIVLSGATQRKDRAATVPEGMKDSAAHKLGTTLIEKGLAREVRVKSGMPAWRRSEEGGPLALIITKFGRSTVKLDVGDATNGAIAASVASSSKQAASAASVSKPGVPHRGSKLGEVIALLSRNKGASIEELISATGWLPHTTRAALTGLRKRGYGVKRHKPGKSEVSTYRIVHAPVQSLAA
jgi:Protein of unknown function (DUF3489)